jgi:O-antigen/teichoic acid export membrane protein
MSSQVRKLIVQFSHFFTGSAITLLAGLVSFPILTRVLSKEQYGLVGLVTTTMFIVMTVSKAGVSNGIIRYFEQYSHSATERSVFSSTILLTSIFFSVAIAIFYYFSVPVMAESFSISREFIRCFEFMSIYLFVRPVNIALLNLLRVNDKTIMYNVLTTGGVIISTLLSLTLYFIYFDVLYFFVGGVLTEFATSAVLFTWLLRFYPISFRAVSGDLLRKLAVFGTPLLFYELSCFLFAHSARYMIIAINGEAALGVYSAGCNMATNISNLLSFPVSIAAVPMFVTIFEREGKAATEKFLAQSLYYFFIASIAVFFGFWAVCRETMILLASQKYAAAASFSPVILCGSLLVGVNGLLNAGLYVRKKTVAIMLIMASAALLNVAGNYFLLPVYDVMGAAISSLVCSVYVTVVTVAISYKYLAIRVDRSILFYLLLGVLMFVVLTRIVIASVPVALSVKVFAGCLIFIGGLLFKERELRYRILNSLKARPVVCPRDAETH